MSLYAFGKVIGVNRSEIMSKLTVVGRATSTEFRWTVDDDDVEVMKAEAPVLQQTGVAFSLVSAPGGTDATALWAEATDAARPMVLAAVRPVPDDGYRLFLETRLGRACQGVFGLGVGSAIAFVDGGVEAVFEATAAGCLEKLAEDVRQSWDRCPNRLYVCSESGAREAK